MLDIQNAEITKNPKKPKKTCLNSVKNIMKNNIYH